MSNQQMKKVRQRATNRPGKEPQKMVHLKIAEQLVGMGHRGGAECGLETAWLAEEASRSRALQQVRIPVELQLSKKQWLLEAGRAQCLQRQQEEGRHLTHLPQTLFLASKNRIWKITEQV